MNLPMRLKMAKQKGEQLAREMKIVALPVDLHAIAASRNIVVQPKPPEIAGVSGILMRHGNNFGIMYATHIDNTGFQRFCIGHELGHYFLDGHVDHVLKSGIHESLSGYMSTDPYEQEADSFASGLMMPSYLVSPIIKKYEMGMATVQVISDHCQASLIAAAIRYVELTDDAVAVVVTSGSEVEYCFLSAAIKELKEITYLRRGTPIPGQTGTKAFNGDIENVTAGRTSRQELDIQDWLGGVKSVVAVEEISGLGAYGKTLTILTCPTMVDDGFADDDEDDEETLIESWTPKFR